MSVLRRSVQSVPLLWVITVVLSTWSLTLLAVGRSLPWQATGSWLLLFAVVAALLGWWWWLVFSLARQLPVGGRGRLLALAWLFGPAIGVALLLIIGSYLSDQVYGLLVFPARRVQTVVSVGLLLVLMATWGRAAAFWALGKENSILSSLARAVSSETRLIALASLLAIGVLQALAMSAPIGDDIGKYTEAALAMLDRQPYPVHQAGADLVAAGMSANSPALPGLSVLLAGSFALFGRNLAGLAVMLGAISVLFPIAMYCATIGLTRSHLAAFAAAVLMTLFPAYQIHILGTAVPDTLFVVTLLFAAAAISAALRSGSLRGWALAGFAIALFANCRPEGLNFSLATLGWLGIFHLRSRAYWVGVLSYVLTMAPFSVTYMSVAGSPWPTTFSGTVGTEHLQTNLTYLRDLTLPWYEQAIGLSATGLAVLGALVVLALLLALGTFWKERPGLAFVPLLGYGYVTASLFIHPLILMSYTPVDVLRHWSSGVPYISVTLAFAAHRVFQALSGSVSRSLRQLLLVLAVVVVAAGIYYECDRLAKPEWYFGGNASLLWTGGSYLLVDVIRDPISLPTRVDTRSGEELRRDQSGRLADYNLRKTNFGEPYHWATLMVALFGLLYASVPYVARAALEDQRGYLQGKASLQGVD